MSTITLPSQFVEHLLELATQRKAEQMTAKSTPREPGTITREEVTAKIDKLVKLYAAEHNLSYPDAFSAVRDEDPEFIRLWQNMK